MGKGDNTNFGYGNVLRYYYMCTNNSYSYRKLQRLMITFGYYV